MKHPNHAFTLALLLAAAACSDSDKKADDAEVSGSDGSASQEDAATGASDDAGGGGSSSDASSDAGARTDAGARSDAGGGTGGSEAGTDASGGGNDGGGGSAACDPSAAPTIPKLALETVVSGIDKLVFARQPPGSSDWWLVQQTGKILIHKAGGGADTTVLDVTAEIGLSDDNDERGLLGLAFPPDFATSNTFYIMITPTKNTTANPAQINTDQVRAYKKSGDSATYDTTLVTVSASAVNHNGGSITFGPDNLLYVGTGDGGGGCNNVTGKVDAPQKREELNGKILRLDPARKAQNYAAEGNPFADNPLVYHYGLRNPFRFSLDSATGDLFIGDVGQDSYEEVDFAKASQKGLNFGWAAFEGVTATCSGRTLRAGDTKTDPIFIADRRKTGCSGMYCDWISVIGGVVYRGSAIEALKGVYVFGDYKGVRMAALRQCEGGTSPVTPIRKNADPNNPNAASFGADDFTALVAIVEDNAKELHFVVNRNSLRKVVPVR